MIKVLKEKLGIWVLQRGKFEDYATENARKEIFIKEKVSPAKLLSVCLDLDSNIREFFDIEEYCQMMKDLEIT